MDTTILSKIFIWSSISSDTVNNNCINYCIIIITIIIFIVMAIIITTIIIIIINIIIIVIYCLFDHIQVMQSTKMSMNSLVEIGIPSHTI